MRGYYEARFRDKCEMDIALELRQHVWRRNGIVEMCIRDSHYTPCYCCNAAVNFGINCFLRDTTPSKSI